MRTRLLHLADNGKVSNLTTGIRTTHNANSGNHTHRSSCIETAIHGIRENRISARIIVLVCLIISLSVMMVQGATYTSVATGNWNADATWSGTGTPVAGDIVNIVSNHVITVNIFNAECASVTLGGTANNNNTGTLTFSGINPSLTVSGAVTVGNSGHKSQIGTITFISGSTLTAGSLVLGVVATQASVIDMSTGGTLKIGGAITTLSADAIWKPGTGTVELTATNTLPATIFTSFNNLIISSNTTKLGAITTINGILDLTSGSLDVNSFAASSGALTGNGILTNTSTAKVFTTGSRNTSTTFSGTISSALGITKTGTGTLTLSGVNTYIGATTINAGVLSVNTLANSGIVSSIGTGTTTPAISIGATGVLQYTGSGHSTDRAIILTASGATIDASGIGTLTLNGAITGNTFGLVLTGTGTGIENGVIGTTTGSLTKNGTGTWILSGSNTYTGVTTMNAGTLTLGAAGVIPNSSNIILKGGTFKTGDITGYSEQVGSLNLNANSTIALGIGGHSLNFNDSHLLGWTAGTTLTITGWTGSWNGTTGTSGKIFVGSTSNGLTATQLSQIRFYDGSDYYSAVILTSGEVVANTPPAIVDVYKGGVLQKSYQRLKQAFDDINSGIHTGDLEIRIIDNTTETASAVLNASGSGGASYSSLNIYPTVTGKGVNGNLAGSPVIDLNGADNVIIDGRVNATGATKDLTITNTSTAATAGTSTIRFINDANNNFVKYCNVKGASTDVAAGILFFSTTIGIAGNDGNTIDNNNITNAGSRPVNAIYSSGTSGNENSENVIRDNNVFNFLNSSIASNGINIAANSTSWTISGNSFYETSSLAPTTSVVYNIVQINNSLGNNFTVSKNFIGGSSAQCGGSAWIKTNTQDNVLMAINVNVGITSMSSIQSNTIKNFSWGNVGAANWTGVNIAAGNVTVDTTTVELISIVGGATGANVYGINISSTGTVDCQNNTLSSITTDNISTNATNFYGINKTGSGTTTISGNKIGNETTANSIKANSLSTTNVQYVYGIYNAGTGAITINNNIIANLTNAVNSTSGLINGLRSVAGTNIVSNNTIFELSITNANGQTNLGAAVCGISLSGNNSLKTVFGNTIHHLTNFYSPYAGSVIGLYIERGDVANTVSRNFIHSLQVTGANANTANIYGIKSYDTNTSFYNNIISLDGDNQKSLYGIYVSGANLLTCNLYFNTVYIYGVVNSGNNNSYCVYSESTSGARNYRNNVLVNARSKIGGTSFHYAIYLGSTTNLTCNYNDYYVSGLGGVLGYYGSNIMDLATWKSATLKDANSLSTSPYFIAPGSLAATNYQLGVDLGGITGTGILIDYGLTTRASTPTMGAWEQNRWIGAVSSSDWNTPDNWSGGFIPDVDASIVFDATPLNHCQLDQNRSVTNISNAQSTYRMVTNGFKLTVKGNLNFTNGAQIDATATSSTINYAGVNAQTIAGSQFTYDKVYNLTVDNAVGLSINADTLLVNNSLTINSGKLLIIPTAKQLNVSGAITNNAGSVGLVIKASSTAANGSLIFHNTEDSPVQATVEMYSKAFKGTGTPGSLYKWQFFGVPLRSVTATPTFDGSYVREMHENVSGVTGRWVPLNNASVLTSFSGYEITQDVGKTITFNGELVNSSKSTGKLSYTVGATYIGQHLIGNPYTAAIDIKQLVFGTTDEGIIENTVYLYNTGSYSEWETAGSGTTSGVAAGQYFSVPKEHAGDAGGIPRQIPSMQAFMVNAMSDNDAATLTIPYGSVSMKNTDKQRAPGVNRVSSSDIISTIIDVKGAHFTDRMWIFTDPNSTHNFDNGWDGRKMFGSALAPQLFAMEADGDYQINSVDDINNTELGFQAGVDTMYTLVFTHDNVASRYPALYLVDLLENKTVDITLGDTEYAFEAQPTATPVKRFKIVTQPDMPTAKPTAGNKQLKIIYSRQLLFIHNLGDTTGELLLYTISGQLIKMLPFSANGITTLPLDLPAGSYVAKGITKSEKVIENILIR